MQRKNSEQTVCMDLSVEGVDSKWGAYGSI